MTSTRATQAFSVDDLYLHKVLSTISSGPRQQWLVYPVKRALRDSDGYETTLWGLRPGKDGRARRLLGAEFAASHARLRPDGNALAFLSHREDSGAQVQLLTLNGGAPRQLTHLRNATPGRLEQWSADGTRLLATASIACADPGAPHVATFAPYKQDGGGFLAGSRTHLFAIDARSGAATALTSGDFDVVAGAWSPDDTRLAYLRKRSGRDRHRTDLWLAADGGGNAAVLLDTLASIEQLAWSPDGRWIALAGAETAGDSQVGLWLLDPASGALRRLVDEDFELFPSSPLQWHTDSQRIAVVADIRGQHRIAVVPIAEAARPRVLSRGLRAVQTIAQCGDRLAFVAMGMRRLNDVYTCAWDGSDERRLTRLNPWFRERPRPRVRKRGFQVPDGNGGTERIEAWVLLPAAGDGPYPLLVDFHGGPNSIVLTDYTAHTYWYLLLSKGWAIVAPNAVGSASYGRDFARRLTGRWGELDLPQVQAVVAQLQAEGLADTRLACAGKSYGGFLAAWAIGHCDLFKAAAVSAPVANLLSHMGTSDTGYYVTPFAMGCEPEDDPERYRRLSPVTYCHRIRAATLLLQGEDDGRCPRGQSEELFANLVRCSKAEVELAMYPRSSHAEAESGRPSNRVDYHQRLADWVATYTNCSKKATGR
jgi:dipeptidyl aminopeptidase/acylaminoacyl peptidase